MIMITDQVRDTDIKRLFGSKHLSFKDSAEETTHSEHILLRNMTTKFGYTFVK